jgi:RHS repeat-associated protein
MGLNHPLGLEKTHKLESRTKESEVRTYLYGQNTQVLEETLNGKRYALYGWGPDGLVSRTDANGQSLFYLKDAQGKIMALVDTQDNVVKDNQYSAFGEDLSGKDAVNPFRFVGGLGGRKDDDTGLVYFWNRWYDPSVGRWVSEDPIRQAGGLNLYGYVANNPLLGTDLNGLDPIAAVFSAEFATAAAYESSIQEGDSTTTADINAFIAGATAATITTLDPTDTSLVAASAFGSFLGEGISELENGQDNTTALSSALIGGAIVGAEGSAYGPQAEAAVAQAGLGTGGTLLTAGAGVAIIDAPITLVQAADDNSNNQNDQGCPYASNNN